jgi:hypothetical protein
MGERVQLRSPIDIHRLGRAFVVDASRAAEGLLTDKELQEKYELSPIDWERRIPRAFGGEADPADALPAFEHGVVTKAD